MAMHFIEVGFVSINFVTVLFPALPTPMTAIRNSPFRVTP